jgi:hypothetical protein
MKTDDAFPTLENNFADDALDEDALSENWSIFIIIYIENKK